MRSKELEDDPFGALRLSEDEDWWEATVSIEGEAVKFKIGGDSAPSLVLIAHARDIVQAFDSFADMMKTFLAEEARKNESYAEEIRRLRIGDVCLFWPERPEDGMIYFAGGEAFRVWRCDYEDRAPRNLGFDQ